MYYSLIIASLAILSFATRQRLPPGSLIPPPPPPFALVDSSCPEVGACKKSF